MMRALEDLTYKEMVIEFVLFNLDKRRLRENMSFILCKNLF